MRFFKMPNSIFSYSLTPKAILVYAYINSRMNSLHAAILSYDEIAGSCRMDRKTAAQAVRELLQRGVIEKKTRRNYRGKLKNRYMVGNLSGGWFKIEYRILQTQIRSTDFAVYCYIKKCMDSRDEAFPSLNAIVAGTGISHSRVVQAVQYLRRYTFINHVRRHYRQTKAFRHNRYLLFRLGEQKKEARSTKRVSHKHITCCSANYSANIAIVEYGRRNVKLFFANRGSPYFPHLLSIPTNTQIKRNSFILSVNKSKYRVDSKRRRALMSVRWPFFFIRDRC